MLVKEPDPVQKVYTLQSMKNDIQGVARNIDTQGRHVTPDIYGVLRSHIIPCACHASTEESIIVFGSPRPAHKGDRSAYTCKSVTLAFPDEGTLECLAILGNSRITHP